jgi:hypothetical protein
MTVAAGEPVSPLDALRAKGMSGEELMVHAKTLREHLHHGFANVVEDEAERVLCLTALERNARMQLLPPPVTLSLHLEAAKEVLMDLRCTLSAERPSLGYLADLIESRIEIGVAND